MVGSHIKIQNVDTKWWIFTLKYKRNFDIKWWILTLKYIKIHENRKTKPLGQQRKVFFPQLFFLHFFLTWWNGDWVGETRE